MNYFTLNLNEDEYQLLEDILVTNFVTSLQDGDTEVLQSLCNKLPSFKYRTDFL